MKINTNTLIRIGILFVTLVNQVLTMANMPNLCSLLHIDNSSLELLITNLITISSSLWCAWKNNSITPKAILADTIKAIMHYDEMIEIIENK